MGKATTVLTPREVMVRLARAWRPLFNDINAHYTVNNQGKVVLDKKTVEDINRAVKILKNELFLGGFIEKS